MTSDLEGAEEQVVEEADEAQEGLFGDGLIDDEGEEDGVNAQQRDKGQGRLGQPERGREREREWREYPTEREREREREREKERKRIA